MSVLGVDEFENLPDEHSIRPGKVSFSRFCDVFIIYGVLLRSAGKGGSEHDCDHSYD